MRTGARCVHISRLFWHIAKEKALLCRVATQAQRSTRMPMTQNHSIQ